MSLALADDGVTGSNVRLAFARASELESSGDLEGAVRSYDAMLEIWGSPEVHAWALNNKSILLDVLGRKDEALDAAEKCFVAAWPLRDDEEFDGIAARARAFQASLLGDLGEFERSLAISREVFELYSGCSNRDIKLGVASALLSERDVRRRLNQREEEIEVCDVTMDWLERDPLSEEVMPYYVGALGAKCAALTASGRLAAACEVAKRVDEFQGMQTPAVFRELSFLMMNGGVAFEGAGEPELAVDYYRSVISRSQAGEEGAEQRVLEFAEFRLRKLLNAWN